MSLAIAFWLLAGLNVAFIALAALGYPVFIVVAVLLLVDLMLLEANRRSEKQKLVDEVKNSIAALTAKIETAVAKMTVNPSNGAIIEARLRQHEARISSQLDVLRSFIRADIKDALDRMAVKMIAIENRLNQTKRTLGAAVAVFDERMGVLEGKAPQEELIELEPTDEL